MEQNGTWDFGTMTSNASSSNATTASASSASSVASASSASVSKIEAELRCPSCSRFFRRPLLLPCGHSLCATCAEAACCAADEDPAVALAVQAAATGPPSSGSGDSDRVSLVSESDSGVVVYAASSGRMKPPTLLVEATAVKGLKCPACRKIVALVDEAPVESRLPPNVALDHLTRRTAPTVVASTAPPSTCTLCSAHPRATLTDFCNTCRVAVCLDCLSSGEAHAKHDIQPLIHKCKSKKNELSQLLQTLSERAKAGTEQVQKLRVSGEMVSDGEEESETENQLLADIDLLIRMLEEKKIELRKKLKNDREVKHKLAKESIHKMTGLLTKSTAFIQFGIEMLRESDPMAFLLVSQHLVERATSADLELMQETERCAAAAQRRAHFSSVKSLRAGLDSVRRKISELYSIDRKSSSAAANEFRTNGHPLSVSKSPVFIGQECSCEGNSMTLVWAHPANPELRADQFVLEVDDGLSGSFRRVYKGMEPMCTVEGLHFRSVYRARVKAILQNGQTSYSDIIQMQTSQFARFQLDPSRSSSEILLTNANLTATCINSAHRVLLASTGLSRGCHYWEFLIERFEIGAQPAFGIARSNCNKDLMLGRDSLGWAMYMDSKRSWFLHDDAHFERTDGGLRVGSVVGVRLDCDQGSLSFYVDEEPHGPIAFTELPKSVYYPAVSLTRAVQITMHTGLEPPSESEESDEDAHLLASAKADASVPRI